MNHGSFRAMGSAIGWWAHRPIEEDLRALFEEVEACASRFRGDSELSRLNACADGSVEVSGLLCDLLAQADRSHRTSDGLVDPCLLDELEAAGYDETFEFASKVVGSVPRRRYDWSSVHLVGRILTRPPGLRIDLGGVAKGWTAEEAIKSLSGPALVDAGGDIALRGRWSVGVEHVGERVTTLMLADCGVATSGIDRRRWKGGHHLIDPRTGRPAETGVAAVTVIADRTTQAETAARTALLRGVLDGLAWLETRPEVHTAILTSVEGTTFALPSLKEMVA